MNQPPLVSHTHYCLVGDVTIAEAVAIAPGVVLQASPGSRIVVGKGACLAAGVCIQSRSGVLTVAAGVSLGANVLIVGSGTVGENACVSAGSTLINPQVSAQDVVPPNAIINGSAIGSAIGNAAPSANGRAAMNGFVSVASPSGTLSGTSNGTSNNGVQLGHGTLDGAGQAASGSSSLSLSSYDRVYGREQVSQLISALFPGRQSLNGNGNGNGHTDSAPPR